MPLTDQMRKWLGDNVIAQFEQMVDDDGFLPAPWRVFPSYSPTTIGWRMGIGESYMMYWSQLYRDLTEPDKKRYRRKYRAPLHWFYFYWMQSSGESTILQIFIMTSALLTWPMRFFLHLVFVFTSKPAISIPDLETFS